uniref:Protein kinase domain-containing protein n=1 Tax=Tetraselmis chuii TaxID=63592 RepID=A0A7S1SGF6_9CHLO|mmetsp:Transcript_10453/g.18945  ORF Transcript_10453/g.18945 Transcript_10453/m.18945 type:complete len:122 (+) Transcript_10453:3-368(+)|eukprot:CAMPEP_0177787532 /NCGR_PEP_ID=MMETSP0491_2-20121128/21558_1 /TAXON_ID=63592 /ORGANISM="Tetraselmis chuii, Strain PLY429" /LENGTH=121 /DNA_ID=CAMNT_0019308919 /DNA_START=1 /DNA_END=366 /DNA_ORIENTATION=+
MKSIRGSVFWMAPEVIKGTGYGRRADIWSVGCTVLEMLTGMHPWPNLDNHWSAMFHIAKAKHGPPLPDNVSPVCRDFLQCCFQVDARLRPTATELLQHPYVSQIPDALREAEMARGLNHSL